MTERRHSEIIRYLIIMALVDVLLGDLFRSVIDYIIFFIYRLFISCSKFYKIFLLFN